MAPEGVAHETQTCPGEHVLGMQEVGVQFLHTARSDRKPVMAREQLLAIASCDPRTFL